MKINKKWLILCLAIPLAVGGISALITNNAMDAFESLNQPSLTPPRWLFPIAWSALYLLMGTASYLVLASENPQENIKRALTLYGVQLALNFLWPILFFSLSMHLFAFLWLIVLWLLILATAIRFHRLAPPSGFLMIPYLLWTAFAAYLNLGVFLLN